jgi:lipid-A-disaccharide synthase
VVYYICPQVWAWRRSRIRTIAANVDRLLVIFPFEVDVFRDEALRVEFVGHPLADAIRADAGDGGGDLPWNGAPRIALLPGSRRLEIERILPPLLAAAARIGRDRPEASFLIAAPDAEAVAWIRAAVAAAAERPARCEIVVGRTRRVLREARAAWVASGTATLEAAMLGCPTIIVYRMAPFNYALARRLIRVPHIGIVNLVAGREVCPELVQEAANPDALAHALTPLIDDTPERGNMLRAMADVTARLGEGGAAERAAAAVAEEIDRGG